MNFFPDNRAGRRALASRKRRNDRVRKDDLRESVAADLTVITYHPTKGRRRIAGKRIEAQDRIPYLAAAHMAVANRLLFA